MYRRIFIGSLRFRQQQQSRRAASVYSRCHDGEQEGQRLSATTPRRRALFVFDLPYYYKYGRPQLHLRRRRMP